MDVAQTAGAERRAVLKLLSLLIKPLFFYYTLYMVISIVSYLLSHLVYLYYITGHFLCSLGIIFNK